MPFLRSAVVWRARCLTNNQIVAVKILDLEAQMVPLEDLVHEAQTMRVGQPGSRAVCGRGFLQTAGMAPCSWQHTVS